MSYYVNSCYSTDMDKFYAVYLSVIIVGKQTCVIPRDLRHTQAAVGSTVKYHPDQSRQTRSTAVKDA